MKHEFKVTTNGNAAVIACMALSMPPTITRVGFGAGLVPEGTDLADVHALVEPVADGAILNVRHAGNRLSFTVQYANVSHPETGDFPLSEYMVYITDPMTGKETDYLYGTLGDYRQPIPQYLTGSAACVFSYPLEVILSGALEVHVDAPPGLLTWLELGRPGGVASLDGEGKIPREQLPPDRSTAAGEYSEALAYSVGDYCARDGRLYRCIIAVPAGGAWDPDCWEETSLVRDLQAVRAAAEGKQDAITAVGLLKRTGSGKLTAAVPGEDYALPDASPGPYYREFEAEDWSGGALRVPQSEHGAEPVRKACMYQLRQRVDRTARDYFGDPAAALGRTALANAEKAALDANASAPGTYPEAGDGHIPLTWEQVQYYILEGVLASSDEAAAKAAEKGFDWKDLDTAGTPETATLEELLTAAYVPALGGSSAALDSLCTDAVLRGLRLRRKEDGAGSVERYDLEGVLAGNTWCAMESRVYWDLDTGDLVIRGDTPFAGDVFVQGGSGAGAAGGGAGAYVLPVAAPDRLGGVKASDTLTVDPDGTAHAVAAISPECFATSEEVNAVLDDVFGTQP